jgi:hypothetical protein
MSDCLFHFDVVAEQQVLIADIELSIRDDWMCPRWCVTSVGLFKATALRPLRALRLCVSPLKRLHCLACDPRAAVS